MDLVSLLDEDPKCDIDLDSSDDDDDDENLETTGEKGPKAQERSVLRHRHGPLVSTDVRRVLRRRISAQSSDRDDDDDDQTELELQKRKPSRKPAAKPTAEQKADVEIAGQAKIGDYAVWYASARMQAFRKKAGEIGEPACMMICDDPSGFLKFKWNDGMEWQSEEPQLIADTDKEEENDGQDCAEPEPEMVVKKKPAVMKKPEGLCKKPAKDDWKNAHSRTYHRAAQAFQKLVKEGAAIGTKQEYVKKAVDALKKQWKAEGRL